MAKISTKKINTSDYSKANQPDISNLARSLNPFMDDIERILRKGLTVDDNLPFQYLTFSCEVDASNNPKVATKLTSSLTTTIKGVLVVSVSNTSAYPTASPFIVFDAVGSNIEIKKVFGLPPNTKFEITVLVVS